MIRTVCVVPPEGLRRNVERAVGLGLPRLAARPAQDVPLAFVGGGVSSGEHLDEILAWPGDVMTTNGGYDWLQDCGRVADYVCLIDPIPELVDFTTRPQPGTVWLVATMCDPAVFASLNGRDVLLWDAPQGDDEVVPGSVPGGPTGMTRAPLLAAILGYRDITLFGADSCYRADTSHVYGGSLPDGLIRVECGQRSWITTLGLLAQAEYLAEMVPAMNAAGVAVRMVGDHLSRDLLNHGSWELAA